MYSFTKQIINILPLPTRVFYWIITKFPKLGNHMLTASLIVYDESLDKSEKIKGEEAYKNNPIEYWVAHPESSSDKNAS